MERADRFKEEIIARLRYIIELRRLSVTGIEKGMGRGRGYLGDALRGEKRLSLDILLEVLDYLDIAPAEFFGGQTSEERRWSGKRLRDGSEPGEVAETAEPRDPLHRMLERDGGRAAQGFQDLVSVIQALIRLLDRKGVVTRRELTATLQGEGR